MSIRTSFNPMGTLGNVKLLESCLFAQSYVDTDVFSATNERFDFDFSYAGGITGENDVVDMCGYLDKYTRRFIRKIGPSVGRFCAFYGYTSVDCIDFQFGSNDVVGSLDYANGVLTAELNGVIMTHACNYSPNANKIKIGLRTSDPGRFRFRNLKVTQNGALSGDFVPCLIGGEVCIKNLVTGAVLHAAAGTLQL